MVASLTITVAVVSGAPPAVAQDGTAAADGHPCVAEAEPNDAPDQAGSAAGGACLAGTLPSGDQDLVVWESSPTDSQGAWTVTVEGVPGARTIVELRPVTSTPGATPLVVGGPLIVITQEPGASEAVIRADLLLAPGRYLVGASAGGQPEGPPEPDLGYRVTLAKGADLPASGDIEPNDDAATASPVEGAFALSGDLSSSTDAYRWTVSPDAAAAWTLRAVTQLGSSGSLTLATGDGEEILVRAQAADGLVELPDLALPAGEYLLTVDPPASAPTPYVLSTVAAETPLGDAEPNDTPERAIPMTGVEPLAKGRLGRVQDEDWYRLGITEGLAAGTVDIRMLWATDLRRELCLYAPGGDPLLCRESSDGINMSGLSLGVGEHHLRVRGDAAPDDPYLLRVDPAGTVGPDFEREPNDSPEMATAVEPGMPMRARALDADVDHFRVSVSGDPQLWQVDAYGTGIDSLDWMRPNGERLAGASVSEDGSAASLVDLYLTPGEHWLRVGASDAEYALEVTPLGPPDPNAEREPNDLPAREERLAVGRERVGRLPTSTDTDVYRFTVRGLDHLRLSVEPPPDGDVDVLVMDGIGMSRRSRTSGARPLHQDLLLGPGDYQVVLLPLVPSQERYAISLERLDPFLLADDQEPNDSLRTARPMPPSGTVSGTADATSGMSESDWYALAPSADGGPLRIVASGDITALAVHDGVYEQTLVLDPDGATYASGPVAPGAPLFLRVGAVGPYTLQLADATPGTVAVEPPSALRAELMLDHATVAAWWPTGQRLAGVMRLTNTGEEDLDITLDALTSDQAWHVDVPGEVVRVAAASQAEVPVEVVVPADVPGDGPVRVSVRARGAAGAQATASADLEPSREAPPIDQVRAWSIPGTLLGGLDVASLALGAVPIPSLDLERENLLHDGFAASDWGLSWPIGGLPVTLTMELAGDEPVPVAGTILHPLSEDLALGDAVRGFELALSLDGGTWETVLAGDLDPVAAEQAFALLQPVEARFAQLRVTSLQREIPSRINLGEWKVVAVPGWQPPGGGLDLADPLAGGHVVWMQPQPGSVEQASILDDDPTARSLALEAGAAVDWVIGFMDDRAALVSTVEWRDPVPSDAATRLGSVDVFGSLESPLGPWRSLGEWQLERATDGSVAPLLLESPTWVRFLRFSGSAGPKQERVELPDRIRVLEAAQVEAYRSILGQWGMGKRAGPLEWGTPVAELGTDDEEGSADSADRPRDLPEGEVAAGRVHFGRDTDWYRVTIPDAQHTLALTVAGPASVGAALSLYDDGVVEVPMSFGPGQEPATVTYLAGVEPGATYRVEVAQPRSSIVVTFDTSASVVTQLAAIEAGLRGLSEGMSGDREALRIVPFDDEPLLPDWSSDPYQIADAVNRYSLGESSSQVEANLRTAALELASREGGRAVLLVTDAASSAFAESSELWAALGTVRPQVFTLEVGGEGEETAIERHHLMADWSASAGGFASNAAGSLDVQHGFDRMATWLRRPVAYELSYRTSPEEQPPLPPGRLSVLAPEVEGRRVAVLGGDAVVELVVDTSGSMRKRLGDQTRIDIAKDVLTGLVRDDLPPGAQVALRQFPPQSDPCGSSLLTPPGPLEPASAISTIARLTAPKDARTPLARAIAAVADDLEGVTGRRIVVVVSDGKESCKGDPAAEVTRLREAGFDVTLNVVGLTLDRASRKSIAHLADLGGGSYFDASDAETLGAALRAAVSAPVHILDASGGLVASGTVGGEAIDVPPGSYEVTVLSDPVITFSGVYVQPEADIVLTLPAPDP